MCFFLVFYLQWPDHGKLLYIHYNLAFSALTLILDTGGCFPICVTGNSLSGNSINLTWDLTYAKHFQGAIAQAVAQPQNDSWLHSEGPFKWPHLPLTSSHSESGFSKFSTHQKSTRVSPAFPDGAILGCIFRHMCIGVFF